MTLVQFITKAPYRNVSSIHKMVEELMIQKKIGMTGCGEQSWELNIQTYFTFRWGKMKPWS